MTIGRQIREPLQTHFGRPGRQATSGAELLDQVGIPSARPAAEGLPAPVLRRHAAARDDRDGARRRGRKLLIADEPTTALDVTIQAQILDLLKRARRRARHGADHDHARPRRRRRHVRARERDVRRDVRRDRGRRAAVRAAAAPVHARAARRASRGSTRRAAAPDTDRGRPARHAAPPQACPFARAAATRSRSRAGRFRRSPRSSPATSSRASTRSPRTSGNADARRWSRPRAVRRPARGHVARTGEPPPATPHPYRGRSPRDPR